MKCPECGSIRIVAADKSYANSTREDPNHARKCLKCAHVWSPS